MRRGVLHLRSDAVRTVLVLGAGGLVGSHVAAAFAGERVVTTYHRTVPPGGLALEVTDATATRTLIERVAPDVVVLAAAEPWVERCEREPEATRAVNVEAARTVARAARDVGATLVVFSSEYVFDGTRGRYTEEDEVRPLNEYGRQKVALETVAREVPRHLICRTSGIFGWEPARKNFVCQLMDRLRAGHRFTVACDQVITPTYAPDLAQGVRALIDAGTTGVVHVVGPQVVLRHQFAVAVCEAFGLAEDLLDIRRTRDLALAAARPLGAGLADTRFRDLVDVSLRSPQAALADMRSLDGP